MSDVPNKKSYPHLVAATMKKQLDKHMDGEIGYTIQQVSRYRLIDIQDAFKPLSSDLGEWFKRLARDGKSPGYALREMDRIVSYTDAIWPEMKAAIDECKDQILPMILKLIRDGHDDQAKNYVKMLSNLEVTWREIKVITGSLLESDDKEELRKEGRRMIIDIMRNKIKENKRGVFYAMHHLDDWGLNLRDWPEIREMIDQHKHPILKEILKALADTTSDSDQANQYAAFMVKRFRKIGLDWPEIAAIEKSVFPREQDKLMESRGDTPEQVIMRYFKHGTLHGLRYMSMYGRTINNMPEAAAAIDGRKEFMVRRLLNLLKQENPESIEEMLNLFRDVGVTWPELDVIEKSFRAEYPRSDDMYEADRDEDEEHDGEDFEYGNAWRKKLEFQEFLKDLRHDIEVQSWDLVALDLIDIGMTDVEDVLPPRTIELIEKNKHGIIRGILERLKVSKYTDLTIHAITALHNIGIKWPELMIINKSLMADKKD